MNSAEVSVLEEPHKVSLRGLLESSHGGALESEIGLEVLSDFTDQALEWELSDQELRALLVLTDLTESHGSRPEPMGLLHSSGSRSRLTSGLGGQLLPWSLASGGFASGLLGTSHWRNLGFEKIDWVCEISVSLWEMDWSWREFKERGFEIWGGGVILAVD